MAAKVLITGMANTGKTSLLKTLKKVLVISRDGKPFPLELPHANMPDFETMDAFLAIVSDKLDAYKAKFGEYPDTIAFDSVSTIFMEIVVNCTIKYDNFKIWENVDKEISKFTKAIRELEENGFNIVLISHVVFDPEAKKYIETTAGKFAKKGGFLSTVEYALNIDIIGKKYIITHKGMSLARTLLDDIPEKQSCEDFNLQEYLNKISAKAEVITKKWSI